MKTKGKPMKKGTMAKTNKGPSTMPVTVQRKSKATPVMPIDILAAPQRKR